LYLFWKKMTNESHEKDHFILEISLLDWFVEGKNHQFTITRGDHFRFGSVFIKKSNQTEIFFWKKTETEPKLGQTGRFRFGSVRFFRAKTGSNRFGSVFLVLARFFSVWLGFGSVFPVWLGFFWFFVGFGSVRFGFLVIKPKPKPNWTGRFFQKKKISVRFFRFFFPVFSV